MKKNLLLIFIFAFAGMSAMAQTTQTFNYTGSVQTFVVPSCVTSITFDVTAASGGTGAPGCSSTLSATGGLGGRVQGTLPVTGGDTLNIYVGGAGADDNNTSASGGFNGGGDALLENQYVYYGGGGGGGASDIRLNGNTLNDRAAVAGGGGGAGQDGCNCEGLTGGAGGGLTGGAGLPGTICICDPSGQGGTPTLGGIKGDWGCNCDATDGAFGIGGNSNSTGCGGPTGGAGGGGGWYGGGGGGLGAGGGGSSYTAPSATGVVHTQGFQTGNGIVIITYTGGSGPAVALGNDSTQCGGTVTLNAGNSGSTYMWSTTDTTQTIVVTATGTYSVTVTDINGCTGSDVINVTINPLPAVSYVETQTLVCINWAPITLTPGSPAGGTYSGTAVTGNMFDPATAGAGAFTITYTYTDTNGCVNTDTSTITVDLCTGIALSGVEATLEVFPNPATNHLTIAFGSKKKKVEVTITDITGKIIYATTARETLTLEVNTKDFAEGVYIVAVKDGESRGLGMVVRKVVKM
ncbi:MAG TPA: glycine-rich protein [Bacteroidia bacterium]|nr:glycine-rich protein [Bacteroidia bacterium]